MNFRRTGGGTVSLPSRDFKERHLIGERAERHRFLKRFVTPG